VRRSEFDIIAKILRVAQQEVLKDDIIEKCHLGGGQSNRYISILLQNGLLHAISGCPIKKHLAGGRYRRRSMLFQTSKAGNQLLEIYNMLQEQLKTGD